MNEHDGITKEIVFYLRNKGGKISLSQLKEEIGEEKFAKVRFLLIKEQLALWEQFKDGKDKNTEPIMLVESKAYDYLKDLGLQEIQEGQLKVQRKQTEFNKILAIATSILALVGVATILTKVDYIDINKANFIDIIRIIISLFVLGLTFYLIYKVAKIYT